MPWAPCRRCAGAGSECSFHLGGERYELGTPGGFLRFPMGLLDKAGFVRLMLTAFRRDDWSDWKGRSAAELVDTYAGPGVREAMFERLTRLKFELPCSEVSGAWLGARLHYREGSAPLGYIPGANWTKVLCDGVTGLLEQAGVRVRMGARIARLCAEDGQVRAAELESGERIEGDVFVSTVPTEMYNALVPGDETPMLADIRYSALISVVCATRHPVPPGAYWINLASLDRTAGAIFLLSSLNPTIGRPGDTCVNFVTHLPGRSHRLFQEPDEQLLARYSDDFRAVFGCELAPVLDPRRASPDVFAGLRAQLPQSADAERVLAQRLLRGQLPHLSLDRLHRHGARIGRRDRRRAAGGSGPRIRAGGIGREVSLAGHAAWLQGVASGRLAPSPVGQEPPGLRAGPAGSPAVGTRHDAARARSPSWRSASPPRAPTS